MTSRDRTPSDPTPPLDDPPVVGAPADRRPLDDSPVEVPHADRPVLSVVVVAYGRRDLLRRCLQAVAGASELPIEVVVVDNASPGDLSGWLARCPGVRLISNPTNEGFGPGADRGALVSRGRYVAFVNSDVVVSRGWDTYLVSALESHAGAAAVVPRYLSDPSTVRESGAYLDCTGHVMLAGDTTSAPARVGGSRRALNHGSAATLVVRRAEFLTAGGFGGGYGLGYYEDADLYARWRSRGRELWLEPTVDVIHAGGGSFDDSDRRALMDRNRKRFDRRWGAELRGVPRLDELVADVALRTAATGWWCDAEVVVAGGDADPVEATVEALLGLPYAILLTVDAPPELVPPGAGGDDSGGAWLQADPVLAQVVVAARPPPARSNRGFVPVGPDAAAVAVVVEARLLDLGAAPLPPAGRGAAVR